MDALEELTIAVTADDDAGLAVSRQKHTQATGIEVEGVDIRSPGACPGCQTMRTS